MKRHTLDVEDLDLPQSQHPGAIRNTIAPTTSVYMTFLTRLRAERVVALPIHDVVEYMKRRPKPSDSVVCGHLCCGRQGCGMKALPVSSANQSGRTSGDGRMTIPSLSSRFGSRLTTTLC